MILIKNLIYNLYHKNNLNIGVNNRTIDGTNGSFSPYVGFGTYWKIKVKK